MCVKIIASQRWDVFLRNSVHWYKFILPYLQAVIVLFGVIVIVVMELFEVQFYMFALSSVVCLI